MSLCFVDTNILIYSIGGEQFEPRKAALARDVLDRFDCALSVQVFQEFYTQATRPSRKGALTHNDALDLLSVWSRLPIQEITLDIFRSALDIKARYRLSYWDSAIVAAAQALNCATLFTEDLGHGMKIGGTTVVNPFL